jgi:hypothetical protein
VTYLDTLVLLREGSRWRVWLGALEREQLDSMARSIREDYLEVPLRVRGARAATWLRLAGTLPKALVPADEKMRMDSLVLAASFVDSLTFTIRVTRTMFLRLFEGTVANTSSRRVAEVRLDVWKNGIHGLLVVGLQPHASTRLIDQTHLDPGVPDSIVVMDLALH